MKKTRMDYNDVSRLYNRLMYIWILTSLITTLLIIIFYFTLGFVDLFKNDELYTLYELSNMDWFEAKNLGASGHFRHLMNNFLIVVLIIWLSCTGLILLNRLLPIRLIYIPLSIAIYLLKIACYITAILMLLVIPTFEKGLSGPAFGIFLTIFIIQGALPFIELIIFFVI
nr:hypothetical protein [Acholeplasmatales bacterium]